MKKILVWLVLLSSLWSHLAAFGAPHVKPTLTSFNYIITPVDAGDHFEFLCPYEYDGSNDMSVFAALEFDALNGSNFTAAMFGYINVNDVYLEVKTADQRISEVILHSDYEGFNLPQSLGEGDFDTAGMVRAAWADWEASLQCTLLINGIDQGSTVGDPSNAIWLSSPDFDALVAHDSGYWGSSALLARYKNETRGYLFASLLVTDGNRRIEGPEGQTYDGRHTTATAALPCSGELCYLQGQFHLPFTLVSESTNGLWHYSIDVGAGYGISTPNLWIMELPY